MYGKDAAVQSFFLSDFSSPSIMLSNEDDDDVILNGMLSANRD